MAVTILATAGDAADSGSNGTGTSLNLTAPVPASTPALGQAIVGFIATRSAGRVGTISYRPDGLVGTDTPLTLLGMIETDPVFMDRLYSYALLNPVSSGGGTAGRIQLSCTPSGGHSGRVYVVQGADVASLAALIRAAAEAVGASGIAPSVALTGARAGDLVIDCESNRGVSDLAAGGDARDTELFIDDGGTQAISQNIGTRQTAPLSPLDLSWSAPAAVWAMRALAIAAASGLDNGRVVTRLRRLGSAHGARVRFRRLS